MFPNRSPKISLLYSVKLPPGKGVPTGVFHRVRMFFIVRKTLIISTPKLNSQFLQIHSLQINFTLTFAPRENPVIRGLFPAFIYKKPLA